MWLSAQNGLVYLHNFEYGYLLSQIFLVHLQNNPQVIFEILLNQDYSSLLLRYYIVFHILDKQENLGFFQQYQSFHMPSYSNVLGPER